MFIGLAWPTLEKQHGGYWEKLRTKYGLAVDRLPPLKSLDEIAAQCIKLCYRDLFVQSLPNGGASQIEFKAGVPAPDFLEQHLAKSLADHLVVTFAHRFYCDNLETQDRMQCLEEIFACQNVHLPAEEDCEARAKSEQMVYNSRLRDFCVPNLCKCETYLGGVANFIKMYKQWEEADLRAEEGGQLTPYYVSWLNQQNALLDGYISLIDMLAAPNWLYTLVIANNWKNHPYNIKKKGAVFSRDYQQGKNLLEKLVSFIGDNPWTQLLLSEQKDVESISAVDQIFPNLPLKLGRKKHSLSVFPVNQAICSNSRCLRKHIVFGGQMNRLKYLRQYSLYSTPACSNAVSTGMRLLPCWSVSQ